MSLVFNHNRREQKYRQVMKKRQLAYWKKGHYLRWLEYAFLEWSSKYGTSLPRWALTVAVGIIFMALAFAIADQATPEELRTIPSDAHWFDYLYFSSMSVTTVGYGDFVPLSLAAKILAVIQAFTGFIMLGLLMGMLHKKI